MAEFTYIGKCLEGLIEVCPWIFEEEMKKEATETVKLDGWWPDRDLGNECFEGKCKSLKLHQSAWYGSERCYNFSESTDNSGIFILKMLMDCEVLMNQDY